MRKRWGREIACERGHGVANERVVREKGEQPAPALVMRRRWQHRRRPAEHVGASPSLDGSVARCRGSLIHLPFDSLQPHYNLVHREEFERELAAVCKTYHIGVIPYSPLAGGFLTGKYRRNLVPNSARSVRGKALFHREILDFT